MIYRNYSEVLYPFLHDAALVLSKRFNLEGIYMDNRGELCLTFKGELEEKDIKEVLQNIIPNDICKDDIVLEYNLYYCYSEDMQHTHVYSPDSIDYRKL